MDISNNSVYIKHTETHNPFEMSSVKVMGVQMHLVNGKITPCYRVLDNYNGVHYLPIDEVNNSEKYCYKSYDDVMLCGSVDVKDKTKTESKKKSIIGKWSTWMSIDVDDTDNIFTFFVAPSCPYDFRTNGKRIELRLGDTKASASCNDGDKFDLVKGLELCFARLKVKRLLATM